MSIDWPSWTFVSVVSAFLLGTLTLAAGCVSALKASFPPGTADSRRHHESLLCRLDKISGKLAADANFEGQPTMEAALQTVAGSIRSTETKLSRVLGQVESATKEGNKQLLEAVREQNKGKKEEAEKRQRIDEVYCLNIRLTSLQRLHSGCVDDLSKLEQTTAKTESELEEEQKLRGLRDHWVSEIKSADLEMAKLDLTKLVAPVSK